MIGSIDPSEGKNIGLYEAIQEYADGKGRTHQYILASSRGEATEVMDAWSKRNGPDNIGKVWLRYLHDLGDAPDFNNSGTPRIITGSSLKLEEEVADNINLED